MVLKWAGVFQEFSTQVSYSVLQCIRSGGSFQSFLFFLAVLHVGFLENK